MILEQTLTLDLLQAEQYPVVRAKQGDDASRFLKVAITREGESYAMNAGVTALFRCLKEDGHSCMNPAVVNGDGTITVELTEQVLAVPGTVWADISLTGENEEVLSTMSFQIRVDPAPLGLDVNSTNELLLLKKLIKTAQELKAGDSAYTIALKHGFAGTEEEWLASLQGKDGYTPVRGVDYGTDADMRMLIAGVLAELEIWEGGSY